MGDLCFTLIGRPTSCQRLCQRNFGINLRARFARLLREGSSGREASRRLQVSAATSGRWARQIRSTGTATVVPMGRPSGTGRLDAHVGFLLESVRQDPDITFFELRDAQEASWLMPKVSPFITLRLRCVSSARASRTKKVAGGHRALTCEGKAAARRLESASFACHRSNARSCCVSGRNGGEGQPDPPARPGTSGWAADHGWAVRQSGHPDLDRRADR